jgi:hypothetical protein
VSVVILLADGVRPDTLAAAMDDGALPALARLRAEGAMHTVSSVFPSVTGPAYAPFLMGRFPGPIGLPGLRWYDRTRERCGYPGYARSYVGPQLRELDADLDERTPTMFDHVPASLATLSPITRGLARDRRIGALTIRSALRAARTHFTGDVAAWLTVDREVADEVIRRTREERPKFVFAAMVGVDKASHALGQRAPLVTEALRIVDHAAAQIRLDAERDGRWRDLHMWVVSDHGHSAVREHEDLADFVASAGFRVVSHPMVFTPRPDVAVMVSGNAMAHLYLDVARRSRPWWPALRADWEPLVAALLARTSVDLVMLPLDAAHCEVRTRNGDAAIVSHQSGRYTYDPIAGDPLGIGAPLRCVTADEAHDATGATDYPDSVVQIAHLAGASRAGDVILSASRDWDFRARFEPIHHVSSHGALHREHMLVPLLVNHPVGRTPRRTTDVMPSALEALGLAPPPSLDGRSFL